MIVKNQGGQGTRKPARRRPDPIGPCGCGHAGFRLYRMDDDARRPEFLLECCRCGSLRRGRRLKDSPPPVETCPGRPCRRHRHIALLGPLEG